MEPEDHYPELVAHQQRRQSKSSVQPRKPNSRLATNQQSTIERNSLTMARGSLAQERAVLSNSRSLSSHVQSREQIDRVAQPPRINETHSCPTYFPLYLARFAYVHVRYEYPHNGTRNCTQSSYNLTQFSLDFTQFSHNVMQQIAIAQALEVLDLATRSK